MFESLANSVGCNTVINCGVITMYIYLSITLIQYVWMCASVCACACACVLCMTLFHVLMLTVGHDSLMFACVYVCLCTWEWYIIIILIILQETSWMGSCSTSSTGQLKAMA